jgi:hypothetical protein
MQHGSEQGSREEENDCASSSNAEAALENQRLGPLRYYDTRTYQPLTGDDALTPTGARVCEHWIKPAFRGEARGRID